MAKEYPFSQNARVELFIHAIEQQRNGFVDKAFVRSFEPRGENLDEDARTRLIVYFAANGMSELYQRFVASGAYNRIDVAVTAYRHEHKALFLDAVGRLCCSEHERAVERCLWYTEKCDVDLFASAMEHSDSFRLAAIGPSMLMKACCGQSRAPMYTLLRSQGARFTQPKNELAQILAHATDVGWILKLDEFQTTEAMTNAAVAIVNTSTGRHNALRAILATNLVRKDRLILAFLRSGLYTYGSIIADAYSRLI